MEDSKIIDLYWNRNENAIAETDTKYGSYCHSIAFHILYNQQDSEECVNDTYLRAWNAIPPNRPNRLSTYLGKITRNLALNRYEKLHSNKRGNGQVALAIEELDNIIASDTDYEHIETGITMEHLLNTFLQSLSKEPRIIFMKRYWYMLSVSEIAKELGTNESRVKVSLHRSRKKLQQLLKKENLYDR